MKAFKSVLILTLFTVVLASCKNERQAEVKTVETTAIKKDVAQNLDPNATYAKVEFGKDGEKTTTRMMDFMTIYLAHSVYYSIFTECLLYN